MRQGKKKKITKKRVAFLLFCVAVPVIHFLVFYVYANASSFVMAFTNHKGAWSFANFTRLWKELAEVDSDIRVAIKNTMITFAITVVAYPFKVLVSYFIYKKVPGYNFFRIVFFLPSIIFGVAIAMVIKQLLGINGFLAQWIGNLMDLKYVPELLADTRFANFTIWAVMLWLGFPGDLIVLGGTFARIPEEVIESARVDGVTWWKEFTRIIVPLVWPTVSLQMILMACGIFGASGSVWLLTQGKYGTHTLSSWMYEYLLVHSGGAFGSNVYNYLSAVGLCLTVIAILLSTVIRRYTDKAFADVDF